MKTFSKLLIIVVLLLITGCNEAAMPNPGTGASQTSSIFESGKIARNGKVSFETDDMSHTVTQIRQMLKKHEGYVVREKENRSRSNFWLNMTVRVPAGKFLSFVDALDGVVDHFESKQITAQDMAEKFRDLQRDIDLKNSIERRYEALLQKANTIDQILKIEKKLVEIRKEIDTLKGELNRAEHSVVYSTLQISFYKKIATPVAFFSKLSHAFANGWNIFMQFVLRLINIWPFVLLFGLFINWVFRSNRKKKQQWEQSKMEKTDNES